MAETNLAYSKIVATPTPTAWSQAYSAGRLFAALSLQTDNLPETGDEHLNALGKDLISTLESEFFTLENKNLDSIKQAINTTIARVKPEIRISFIVCYLSDNILYLFAIGGAKAVLKRGSKIGTVLAGEEGTEIKSASGYVQEGDVIVLQTKPFQRIISPSTLASSLESDSADEIAETLAPHVHDKAEGGASSVILIYRKGQLQDIPVVPMSSDEEDQEPKNEEVKSEEAKDEKPATTEITELSTETQNEPSVSSVDSSENSMSSREIPNLTEPSSPFLADQFPARKKKIPLNFNFSLFKRFPRGLSHSRKIILTVAVILIALIAVSAVLALRNRGASSDKALFASVYEEAKTKYDEGQNLKDLNASLAKQSFNEAKRTLESNKDKFKEGSTEEVQISDLLNKVNTELSAFSTGENAPAKEVDSKLSDLLSYEINNSKANYFVENEDSVFFLDGTGVSEVSKSDDKKTQIIKKSWDEDGGIGLFGSNVYILDRKDGILKFVASQSAYSESDYFPGDAPDLSSSSAMAIDGSIFVLFSSGDVKKYTRGKEDTFSISGLEKPLSSPTKIFTNEDAKNLYILDNGRVVVLDKTGKFVAAYSAEVIKKAKDFDVDEAGKKIFILSSGKVYQIDLK